jgi:zinc protease
VIMLLLALGLALAGEPALAPPALEATPALVLPPASGVSALAMPPVQRRVLPGGAELWFTPRPAAALVALDLRLTLAPALVDPELQAALRLLPSVVDAGGASAPQGLDAALQPLGASVLISSADSGLRLRLVAPPDRLEAALGLVAEALERPALPRRRLRADIAAWRQDEARRRRSSGVALQRAELRAVYPADHPLARQPSAELSIGVPGLRRAHARLLGDGGAVVVVVGAADPEPVAQALAFLGPPPADPGLPPSIAPDQGPAVVLLDDPGARQVRVVVSYPVPPEIGQAEAQLVADLLGGGPTARLEGRLREALGLVYEARAALITQPGHSRLRVSTRLDAGDPGPGLAALHAELAGLDSVGEDELRRARATRLFALARELDGLERHSARLSEQARLGQDPEALQAWLDALAEADRPSVVRAAAAILAPGAATWLVLGDAETLDPVLDELGLAPDREIPLSSR